MYLPFISIYPRLFGTRPTVTRLIGTLKIERVQLERVSLARNQTKWGAVAEADRA